METILYDIELGLLFNGLIAGIVLWLLYRHFFDERRIAINEVNIITEKTNEPITAAETIGQNYEQMADIYQQDTTNQDTAVEKAVDSVKNIVGALKKVTTGPKSDDLSYISDAAFRANLLGQAVSDSILASRDVVTPDRQAGDAVRNMKELADNIEGITAAGVKAAGLADGLVGALKGEETEVKAAIGEAAQLGGQLVGALAAGNVTGIIDAVESVGERAQKLEELAGELGCGESVGAIAGTMSTVSNIITADHTKTKAVVGQAASEVGGAIYGVLSAVGGAITGSNCEGGSAFGNVLSASGEAAKTIGQSIASVADYTEELAGENNFVSVTMRQLSEVNEAAGVVVAATGKTVTKYMAGEATTADVVALGAECLAGATQGVVAVAGGVVAEMDTAVGAVKLTANLCKAGVAITGHYAKSAGVSSGAVDTVVDAVSVATDTVHVAANSVSGVLQTTQTAIDVAGDAVVAAGGAAVQVVESGDGNASIKDVLSGIATEFRDGAENISEVVSGISSTSMGTALDGSPSVANAVCLSSVGSSGDCSSQEIKNETDSFDIFTENGVCKTSAEADDLITANGSTVNGASVI